jgi:hypothetical protein
MNLGDRYNMQETPESHDPADNYIERMLDRADYLHDERRDREMEAAMERSEVTRLRTFIESIVNANGPYPELNGTQIIVDAYAALNPVAAILRNSLPKAVEPAPPVPQRLIDEASAKFMRETPAASTPRFFRETSTGMEWEFRNGKMTTDGEYSIFHSPADILECLDIIETDANGDPLEPSTDDIAAERGDREQQREDDES